jgi:tetratricopeptide (TPR) repeat protein
VIWVDRDACEALLKAAENRGYMSIQALPLLEQALAYLERGELLEGESGTWVYGPRKKSEDLLRQCRLWLAESYEHQGRDLQAGLQYRALLQTVPPDEDALRRWVDMLVRHGKRQEALKCYQDIKRMVEEQGFTLSPAIEQFMADLSEQGQQGRIHIIIPGQDLEEQNMGLSRRNFLYLLGAGGIEASLLTSQRLRMVSNRSLSRLSDTSLHELTKVTAHLRTIHRQGDIPIAQELFAHLSVLQGALNATMDDGQRHELWRLLAQTQLLCRFNLPKRDMVKAKTFNEMAIASARNSGDTALVGAAIGHLAHFYLRIEKAPEKASQLLDEAQPHIQQQRALIGWFALLYASLAATSGNRAKCEKHICTALEMAHDIRDIIDPYFTDFSVVSVNVFAGNSLLTVEQPQKAQEWLMKASLNDLSPNRHASAYYDIARAYVASNQLEAAQEYALKSMDCAVATNNLYIIPRFVSLANVIQQKYPNNACASLIGDYALSIAFAHERMYQ